MKTRTTCNICSNKDLIELINMPKMPITGLYLDESNLDDNLYDQAFNYCQTCGHGQLKNILDPDIIYNDSYEHRTSKSQISMSGNDFLLKTINNIVGDKVFDQALEVGCNDLYLINGLSSKAKHLVGIDPIWKDKDFIVDEKISIHGKFIDELDQSIFHERPDLIVSSHTFEHIDETYEQFEKIVDLAANDCLFFIEVPSLDSTVKGRRFDQIFHQHLQYFSYSSMRFLINRLGCEFMGSKYNYSYWGGTSLFWFRKNSNSIKNLNIELIPEKIITHNFKEFKNSLQESLKQILFFDEKIIGLGAAQMLPTIAYHMESNLDFISKIYDDNDDRVNKYLPYISPQIQKFSSDDISDAIILITALDSSRPLLKKILAHDPRRIFSLINVI
jgi:hypothetical protein